MVKKTESETAKVPVKAKAAGPFAELEKRFRELETRFEDIFPESWGMPSRWELPE